MNSPGSLRFALIAALIAPLAACSSSRSGPAERPPAVPVTVAKVVRKSVPVRVEAIGTVEAFSTVAIKAQVGGLLRQVHFREGQDVHKGDLLFTLDARPYEAALQSAQATLARDTAQMQTAKQDAARYTDLVKKEYVTQEEFDRIQTNAAALEATVRADQAAVDNAAVQREYCTIRAPIEGRTGKLMVNQGNLVKANDDTSLVVINQVDPIYVAFSVPEQKLDEIKARKAAGTLAVQAILPGREEAPLAGTLSFLDNSVDRSTGTVLLKATFPNRERILWPGQFVNVALTLAIRPDALLIPTRAVQTGQKGPYVFVVASDGTAQSRPVVPGAPIGDETIVESGLKEGETIVTDGQLRIVPGAKVEAQSGPAAAGGRAGEAR